VVWPGALWARPTTLGITSSAAGKGLYQLSGPPGGILDRFRTTLTANGLRRAAAGVVGAAETALVRTADAGGPGLWRPLP
jgi:hypothetical protein